MLYIYWTHVRYPGLECHLVFTVIAGDCFSLSGFIVNRTTTIIWGIPRTLLHLLQNMVHWLQCYFVGETLSQPSDLSRWVIHTLLVMYIFFSTLIHLLSVKQWHAYYLSSLLEDKIHKSRHAVHLFITVGQCLAHGRGQEIFPERLTSPRTELLVKNT